ncbi:hypothetical protein [Smaragdicoccus niigatensis]|uniref:hypothetical protein n=1 Tax=Smaragdicoccus niigatensis TaxID=359359 RepID=UPI00036AF591|nr:hypothetical protein [Smaragdicoccus niigatensis]
MHITARHTAKTLLTLALATGGLALLPGTASADFCYASSGNNFVGPRNVSVGTSNTCAVGDGTNNRALAVGSGNTAAAGTNVDSPDATANNNTAIAVGTNNQPPPAATPAVAARPLTTTRPGRSARETSS